MTTAETKEEVTESSEVTSLHMVEIILPKAYVLICKSS